MKIENPDLSVLDKFDAVSYETAAALLAVRARQLRNLVATGKLERIGEGHRRRVTSASVARYAGISRNPEPPKEKRQ